MKKVRYTKAQMVEMGLEQIELHGDLLQKDWTGGPNRPSRSTVCLRFGSWDEFRAACGIIPVTSSDLVIAAQEIVSRTGRLSKDGWNAERPFAMGADAVSNRFGSWTAFCELAGVANGRTAADDARLVQWGADLTEQLGHLPCWREFEAAEGVPCRAQTIINRFGSFNAYIALVDALVADQSEMLVAA